MARSRSTAALLCLALALPGRAAEDPGLFLGEGTRYADMNVARRALLDVVAIPAGVGRWDAADWAQLGLWAGAVGTLWFAGDPSLDVQLDRWITENLDPRLPTVWNPAMQVTLWSSIAVAGFGGWWWAASTGREDLAQGFSLMGEALAVSQAYHVALKLAIGRDGPTDGNGLGEVKGFANAIAVYPAGTPSGHAATLYSLLSAGFAYYRPPVWLQVVGHVLVGATVAFHVIDHRHYLSDSLWGAAMGWYAGRWVVKHRASWRYGERGGLRTALLPYTDGRAAGLALRGFF